MDRIGESNDATYSADLDDTGATQTKPGSLPIFMTREFRSQEFDDLAERLSVCADIDEFSRLLWKVTTSCGFQNFALSVLRPSPTSCFRVRICTSYRQSWIDRYAEMAYWTVDPAVHRAMRSEGSFLLADLPGDTPEVFAFREDAEAHGAGSNGIGFSQVASDGTRIGLNFVTMRSAAAVETLVSRNETELSALATLAMDCFRFVGQEQGGLVERLSVAELRFLRTLARDPDPTKALAITPNFGSNKSLQASIRRKLGVCSIFQALYIVSSRRLFDHLPVEPTDVATTVTGLSGWDLLEAKKGWLE